MKRWMRKLLSLMLMTLLIGCGMMPAEASDRTCRCEGSVLFERNGLTIKSAGLDADPTSYDEVPIIWVDIENSGDTDVCLGLSAGAVNGFMTDVLFVELFSEDGFYYGADYSPELEVPAESSGRYAIGYYRIADPAVPMDKLESMEFSVTVSDDGDSLPDFVSDRIKIVTEEKTEDMRLESLGTVVYEDETLCLVAGKQDYDYWMGPQIYLYLENRSDRYIGVSANEAEADGHGSECVFYYAQTAPHSRNAQVMCFDGAIAEEKGFEELNIDFQIRRAESMEQLDAAGEERVCSTTLKYEKPVWGEYENGGLRMEILPKYNELVTVEVPGDSSDGTLFFVSETASLEADSSKGSGWLFAVQKVDETTMHGMLTQDMSGARVFARDGNGGFYVYRHPTDVRYARKSTEEMQRDARQWTMLCEWASGMPELLTQMNGLESVSFGNSDIEIYIAQAAWKPDAGATLSMAEYGPVNLRGTDGTPYAEFMMQGIFMEADPGEMPDGQYAVLEFPEQDVRADFFFAPGNYVRLTERGRETLYQAGWYDEDIPFSEAMRGWYYAAAEQSGLRVHNGARDPYIGLWQGKKDGDGRIRITGSVSPDLTRIEIIQPTSSRLENRWSILAAVSEEGLSYTNGKFTLMEYDDNGLGTIINESWDESGAFSLTDGLCWKNSGINGSRESVYFRLRD